MVTQRDGEEQHGLAVRSMPPLGFGEHTAHPLERSMPTQRYLLPGLSALSRAGRAHPMAGHLGAAVVAGCLYAEDHAQLHGGAVRTHRIKTLYGFSCLSLLVDDAQKVARAKDSLRYLL